MFMINLSSSTKDLIKIYDEIIPQEKFKNKNLNQNLNFNNKIDFKNISFTYDQKDYVFENLNLNINRSDKIFISGPSGSGKSTLVELLCGLNSQLQAIF